MRNYHKRRLATKSYVVHRNGSPVAAATERLKARVFVYRNTEDVDVRNTSWTSTGKLYVDGIWSGWEIREVETL